MKLLLFLTSLASLSIFGKSCNQGNADSNVQNAPDTLSAALDTFSSSMDTNFIVLDSFGNVIILLDSFGNVIDTVIKDTNYGTSSGKHEAPKHDAPNQEKIDSIKAAKKKKKENKN